eukprot:IDg3880t1
MHVRPSRAAHPVPLTMENNSIDVYGTTTHSIVENGRVALSTTTHSEDAEDAADATPCHQPLYKIGRTTSHLHDLGLSNYLIGLAWLAGPISGIVIQPIIGVLSDHSRHRLGRRRPYMLSGAVLVALSLTIFANSAAISRTLHVSALFIALCSFWTLDIAINMLQAPTRALLADIVHPSQLPTGNACFAVANGVGKTIAYALGSATRDIRVLNAAASMLVLCTVLVTSILVRERAQVAAPGDGSGGAAARGGAFATFATTMRDVARALRGMPHSFRRVFAAQLLSCVAFMLVFIYIAVYFGQLAGGNASAPANSAAHRLYEAGVRRANRALLLMSVLSMVVAPAIPAVARAVGTRTLWGGSQLVVGVALLCLLLRPGALVAEFVVVSVGLPLSNAITIPWSITALETQGALARKRGLHFAVFNLSQAIPGLFASFLGSFFVKVSKGNLVAPLALAGVFAVTAALATAFGVPGQAQTVAPEPRWRNRQRTATLKPRHATASPASDTTSQTSGRTHKFSRKRPSHYHGSAYNAVPNNDSGAHDEELPPLKTAITAYAAQRGLTAYLNDTVPPPAGDQTTHLSKQGEAKLILVTSLSESIHVRIGDEVLDQEPHAIYAKITAEFIATSTPAEHDKLQRRADQTKICARESIDDYLDRHLAIRRDMETAKYPAISNEKDTTVTYMLRGLLARKSLRTIAQTLLVPTCKPTTVKELRETIKSYDTPLNPTGRKRPPSSVQGTRPPTFASGRARRAPYAPRGQRGQTPRQYAAMAGPPTAPPYYISHP